MSWIKSRKAFTNDWEMSKWEYFEATKDTNAVKTSMCFNCMKLICVENGVSESAKLCLWMISSAWNTRWNCQCSDRGFSSVGSTFVLKWSWSMQSATAVRPRKFYQHVGLIFFARARQFEEKFQFEVWYRQVGGIRQQWPPPCSIDARG